MGKKMSNKEFVKRLILLTVGLFFAALGVAFAKRADLGVSPISSVANVLSIKFDGLTLGTWLIIWNCVIILGQIIILRKDFRLVELLQIPLSFVFGWFTDLALLIVRPIPVPNYFVQVVLILIGVVVLGYGITLSVIADLIMNSGEAFVKAISQKYNKNFGTVKVIFDVSCVVGAIVLSVILFGWKVVGTREGTVITAVLTGFVIKFFMKRIKEPCLKFIKA